MKFERESDGIGKALSREDETTLLAACESNQLLRTVVALATNTALQKNEIRTLERNRTRIPKLRSTVPFHSVRLNRADKPLVT